MPDDLTAIEKRPESWRLNLADFQVVYKTTFAKGTISDFQKISDVPLTVKSMVKVKGDWGESDFIPLFFCPKKKYWDSDPSLDDAQDFNQDGKYYENAWRSFRGDDEVKVLLQEGVPKFVIGFVDNVPRIGEAIIKVGGYTYESDTEPDAYWQAPSIPRPDIVDGQGPDGKPLNLTEESQPILGGSDSIDNPTAYYWLSSGVYEVRTSTTILQIMAWPVIVGPIVYVFVTLATGGSGTDASYFSGDTDEWYAWMDALFLPNSDHYIPPPGEGVLVDPPGVISGSSTEPINSAGITLAGIYTKKLMDDIRTYIESIDPQAVQESSDWGTPPEGVQLSGGGLVPIIPVSMVHLFYRPHTKEELQAAGLWPWSN